MTNEASDVMRACNKCKLSKEITTEYYKRAKSARYCTVCKECTTTSMREKNRAKLGKPPRPYGYESIPLDIRKQICNLRTLGVTYRKISTATGITYANLCYYGRSGKLDISDNNI